jgi:hypothetical protein
MTEENTTDLPDQPDPDEVLAELSASGPRRVIGVSILTTLGLFLLYLALWHPPAEMIWRIFLLAFGGFALFGASRLWQCTDVTLELTSLELRERGGRVLTPVANVRDVSRGALAIKPSNGFSLSLAKKPGPSTWAPGLWWRIGRSVGVGGVTSSHEAKYMAEMIHSLMPKRD